VTSITDVHQPIRLLVDEFKAVHVCIIEEPDL